MIEIGVSIKAKRYSPSAEIVLKEIDFTIDAGEVVAIVGPSGAGKSTLLNMVAGLEHSEQGELLFNGIASNERPKFEIGYIFQQPRLMPWLTVSDNIKLVAPDYTADEIDVLLDQVGLGDKGNVYPKELSGGMQRRVSIARAFSRKPQLLLLDEPFVSLDRPNAQRLRVILEQLRRIHKPTVILVTHDLSEAVRLADRILFFSSSPGMLVLEKSVNLPKPRIEGGVAELMWEQALLKEHPRLLDGLSDSPALKAIAGGLYE